MSSSRAARWTPLAALVVAACASTSNVVSRPNEVGVSRQEPAEARRWEVGYHAGVWLGDGEPANDIPIPASLYVRRQLSGPWWARAGFELASGDFETPHEIVGVAQDPAQADIDADAEYLSFLAWIERVHAWTPRDELFVQLGGGWTTVEADDARGPAAGGGTFEIETDADDEILLSAGAGYRRRLWERWVAEVLLRYDHHLADWELRDTVSGATGEVDDYSTWAILIGLGLGF
jgi:hypothetical protein